MKRIPRIKFPERHPKLSTSAESGEKVAPTSMRVATPPPPPPSTTNIGGGKASNQPKRTPVSDKEIEAILLGGCI